MTPEPDRGERYADGGVADLAVHYPNADRIREINEEWDAFDTAVEIEVARQMTVEAIFRPNVLLTCLEATREV